MTPQERVRAHVRGYLDSKGLKQYKLAETAGYTPRQFSLMMTGKKSIGLDDLENICKALGVSATEFIKSKSG